VLTHPGRISRTELIKRHPQRLEDSFEPVEGAHGREDVRRIGPLGPPRLDPSPRFADSEKCIEETLGGVMHEEPVAEIVQQSKVKTWVVQVKAQGIFPIHATAHGIGGLPVSEPFDRLHHHDQRQTPEGYFHRTPLGRIEIGKELIVIERAECTRKST
jgi:hypothetical protein